jgi:aryl carrier-like protein
MTPDEVAMLMQDLLDSDDVAVDDSFFEAGGNSIGALALISQIHQRTGASLSLIEVVRNPTPDSISRLLTAR